METPKEKSAPTFPVLFAEADAGIKSDAAPPGAARLAHTPAAKESGDADPIAVAPKPAQRLAQGKRPAPLVDPNAPVSKASKPTEPEAAGPPWTGLIERLGIKPGDSVYSQIEEDTRKFAEFVELQRRYAPPTGDPRALVGQPVTDVPPTVLKAYALLPQLTGLRYQLAMLARGLRSGALKSGDGLTLAQIKDVDDVVKGDLAAGRKYLLIYLEIERARLLEEQSELSEAPPHPPAPSFTRMITPPPGYGLKAQGMTASLARVELAKSAEQRSDRIFALASALGHLSPEEKDKHPSLAPLFAVYERMPASAEKVKLAGKAARSAVATLSEAAFADTPQRARALTITAVAKMRSAAWLYAEAERTRYHTSRGHLRDKGVLALEALASAGPLKGGKEGLRRLGRSLFGTRPRRRVAAAALAALLATAPEKAKAAPSVRVLVRRLTTTPFKDFDLVTPGLVMSVRADGHHPVLAHLVKSFGLHRRNMYSVPNDYLEVIAARARALTGRTAPEGFLQAHRIISPNQTILHRISNRALKVKYGDDIAHAWKQAGFPEEYWERAFLISVKSMRSAGIPFDHALSFAYRAHAHAFSQLFKGSKGLIFGVQGANPGRWPNPGR